MHNVFVEAASWWCKAAGLEVPPNSRQLVVGVVVCVFAYAMCIVVV